MVALLGSLISLLMLPTLQASAARDADAVVRVDAAHVLNRITPWMTGSCIEDVNHEIYGGLYAQMIFGESFEEPPPAPPIAGWSAYGGRWSSTPEGVAVEPDAGAKLVRDTPEIADGQVSCEVRLRPGGDNAGLILRVQSPRVGPNEWRGYEVSLGLAQGGYVRLGRHRDDWQLFRDVPTHIEPDQWMKLRVRLTGPHLEVFVGEATAPVLTVTDSDAPLLSGRVGVRTWNSAAEFRHFTVEPAGGASVDGFAAPSAATAPPQVSGLWDPITTGTAHARFTWESRQAFNTLHSQRIELTDGGGTVGVANRGLNRWGLAVRQGQVYAGRVYLRQEGFAGRVTVALQSSDGSRTYAFRQLRPVGANWTRCDFTLRPDTTDPNARFALWIDRPGAVWVDQATLTPTGTGLFKGLPVRADIAKSLVAEGLSFLRYGGTMVNAEEYRWKRMIGDRDHRSQYHGFWYPYSTNGFGIEDFVQFCRAAGFECLFAINIEETPEDAADLVEYLNGPASSPWGRRRAANGHPAPYGVRYIEIGNEETTNRHYLERFQLLEAAIHRRDPQVQLVIAAWWEPNNPVSREIVQALNGKAALWDVHVGGDGLQDGEVVDRAFTEMERLVQAWAPGTSLKACVLEENGGRHDLQRALGHARILNATERHGDFVLIDCPANCLQPWKQNDNGWDQGQVFFTSGQVWTMPPYYAQQMAAQTYLPLRVESTVEGAPDLDVTATRSEAGETLVLKMVNTANAARHATIALKGFGSVSSRADRWTLSGALEAVNTPEAPEQIHPEHSSMRAADSVTLDLAPYSYTVLRFKRASK